MVDGWMERERERERHCVYFTYFPPVINILQNYSIFYDTEQFYTV